MIVSALAGSGIKSPSRELVENRLVTPEGFCLNCYATAIPGARMLLVTAKRVICW